MDTSIEAALKKELEVALEVSDRCISGASAEGAWFRLAAVAVKALIAIADVLEEISSDTKHIGT